MKRGIVCVILFFTALVSRGQDFRVVPVESQKMPVTYNRMTNLVFPVAIRTVVGVSRDIVMKKPSGVENVLELQAAVRRFPPTNISVYGSDGRLYAFELAYADSPAILNFAICADGGLRPGIMLKGWPVPETDLARDADSLDALDGAIRKSAIDGGVGLVLKGIYLKDGCIWMGLRVRNRSTVVFRPDLLRLSVSDGKHVRRMAQQVRTVDPVYGRVPVGIAGDISFAVAYPVFTVGKGKRVVLHLAEMGGGRQMEIRIRRRWLLRARK